MKYFLNFWNCVQVKFSLVETVLVGDPLYIWNTYSIFIANCLSTATRNSSVSANEFSRALFPGSDVDLAACQVEERSLQYSIYLPLNLQMYSTYLLTYLCTFYVSVTTVFWILKSSVDRILTFTNNFLWWPCLHWVSVVRGVKGTYRRSPHFVIFGSNG